MENTQRLTCLVNIVTFEQLWDMGVYLDIESHADYRCRLHYTFLLCLHF